MREPPQRFDLGSLLFLNRAKEKIPAPEPIAILDITIKANEIMLLREPQGEEADDSGVGVTAVPVPCIILGV
jgi:hypothetical protein